MKKVIKTIKVVLLVTIGTIVVTFMGFFFFGLYLRRIGYDSTQSKKEPPEISIEIQGDPNQLLAGNLITEENIPDEWYYATVEEAIETYDWGGEDTYISTIEEIVKRFDGEDYVSVFYRSVKDQNTECFTACKIKIKEFDGEKRYAFLIAYPLPTKRGDKYKGKSRSAVETLLSTSDYKANMTVKDDSSRFVWGLDRYADIYTLTIEGQAPTEIIPYEELGKTMYFWYYEDLKSKKPGYQLEFEIVETKESKDNLTNRHSVMVYLIAKQISL